MMEKTRYFWLYMLLIPFLYTLVACQDNTTAFNDQRSSQYFPNSVGDSWTYAVSDSSGQQPEQYKLHVKIVGKTTLSNGELATIWQYTWPDRVDSNYVSVKEDTIKVYYGSSSSSPIKKIYVFPLEKGRSWIGQPKIETNKVIRKDTVAVPAGVFGESFLVKRSVPHFNNYELKEDYWFVPGVGLVKKHIFEYNLAPPVIQTWELFSYDLKEEKEE